MTDEGESIEITVKTDRQQKQEKDLQRQRQPCVYPDSGRIESTVDSSTVNC
jgi:hypothetical protein